MFGKPGSGESHALCALSEQLILQGRSLLFTTCSLLVQQLLIAKRDLRLPKLIKQFSSFEGLIIDDLGYVQQSREEMEVLFTLLAERYERGSVLLTSNLAFSKWDRLPSLLRLAGSGPGRPRVLRDVARHGAEARRNAGQDEAQPHR